MQSTRPLQTSVEIDDVTGLKEQTALQRLLASQPFWVPMALLLICAVMSWLQPQAFASTDNFFNITRNFAFVGIMAHGHDRGDPDRRHRPVGRLGHGRWSAWSAAWSCRPSSTGSWRCSAASPPAPLCGAVNGALIAYAGLPPFVVTLGMLSIARSLAIVLSQNQMIYEFGPDGDAFNEIGGGEILGHRQPGLDADRPDAGVRLRLQLHRAGAATSTPSAATRTRPA